MELWRKMWEPEKLFELSDEKVTWPDPDGGPDEGCGATSEQLELKNDPEIYTPGSQFFFFSSFFVNYF